MSTIALTQLVANGNGGAGTPNGTTNTLATGNTYTFQNDGKTILKFLKTGANACTVTITTPGTVNGIAVADPTVNVPATTGNVWVGPFRPDLFNDANGLCSFTVSEATALSVDCISLGLN